MANDLSFSVIIFTFL